MRTAVHGVTVKALHNGGYVVRSQRNGHTLLALDYSRAWLYHGFPPKSLPFAAGQHTLAAARWIKVTFGAYITESSTKQTLDRLEAVGDSDIAAIISNHPSSWITTVEQNSILEWWRSTDRKGRLDAIRQGIKDGTYL